MQVMKMILQVAEIKQVNHHYFDLERKLKILWTIKLFQLEAGEMKGIMRIGKTAHFQIAHRL